MLDQLSNGRLLLGVGRGVSPFETKLYGLDFGETGAMYHEAFQLLLKGLASDELTFHGKYYNFDNVPMLLKPLQRPHPPLWYGTTIPENADWPAENDVNIVTIALRPTVRSHHRPLPRGAREARQADGALPLLGVARHVVVAETDEAALAIARRAYPRWRDSFRWLFQRHGAEPRIAGLYPPTFDELMAIDNGVAGSPQTVREFVAAEIAASGSNYLLAWFAFGDMTLAEQLASFGLFAREVMPAFAAEPPLPSEEDTVDFGYFTLSDNHYDNNSRTANQFVADITAEALYAEELGMHSAWIGEHHFNSLGVLSCPDLVLAYIAARTKRIRLAPAVTVLPLHHPIRVAEQWATLDLLSNGRVDFAIGRGYDRREYAPFHVSFDDNQGIFEEGLDVVQKLWAAEDRISHHGKHYSFDDVRITPKPVQRRFRSISGRSPSLRSSSPRAPAAT